MWQEFSEPVSSLNVFLYLDQQLQVCPPDSFQLHCLKYGRCVNEVNDRCTDVTFTDGRVNMSHAKKINVTLKKARPHFFLNHVIWNITRSEEKTLNLEVFDWQLELALHCRTLQLHTWPLLPAQIWEKFQQYSIWRKILILCENANVTATVDNRGDNADSPYAHVFNLHQQLNPNAV